MNYKDILVAAKTLAKDLSTFASSQGSAVEHWGGTPAGHMEGSRPFARFSYWLTIPNRSSKEQFLRALLRFVAAKRGGRPDKLREGWLTTWQWGVLLEGTEDTDPFAAILVYTVNDETEKSLQVDFAYFTLNPVMRRRLLPTMP